MTDTPTPPLPPLMPSNLMAEVLRPPPHSLETAVAELIFLPDGQLVFCSRQNGVHTAKFLSPEDVKRAFFPIVSDTGWLPPDVVRWGHGNGQEWAVLFKPARVYDLSLAVPEQEQQTIRVPLPNTVILAIGHELYAWAVKTSVFKADVPAFHLPLPNVAQNGRVCFGANQHPPAGLQTVNQIWDIWITGAFTSESCTHKSKAHPNDVRTQLEAIQGRTSYPRKDLILYQTYFHKTVGGLIDQIVEKQ